jgi:hypothetical protein
MGPGGAPGPDPPQKEPNERGDGVFVCCGVYGVNETPFGHPPPTGWAKKAVELGYCGSCSAPSLAVLASVSWRTSSALSPDVSKLSCSSPPLSFATFMSPMPVYCPAGAYRGRWA